MDYNIEGREDKYGGEPYNYHFNYNYNRKICLH